MATETLRFTKVEEAGGKQADSLSGFRSNNYASPGGEEFKLDLAAAHEEGLRKAREQFAADLAAGLVEERRKVERVRSDFANDRQRFFAAAENQVVKLALAVAAKILSREVALDELHLRATVKAALARVQESSATTLHVPIGEVDAWTDFFERTPSGKIRVHGDERMSAGDCMLDTTVGRVELGVDVQLQEVERSFNKMLQTPIREISDGEAVVTRGSERDGLDSNTGSR